METNDNVLASPDDYLGYAEDYDQSTQEQTDESENIEVEIISAAKEIIEHEQDRKLVNDRINAVYSRLEAKGVPKLALKDSLKFLRMTEEQRLIYDNAVLVSRRACGIPIQVDMFDKQ